MPKTGQWNWESTGWLKKCDKTSTTNTPPFRKEIVKTALSTVLLVNFVREFSWKKRPTHPMSGLQWLRCLHERNVGWGGAEGCTWHHWRRTFGEAQTCLGSDDRSGAAHRGLVGLFVCLIDWLIGWLVPSTLPYVRFVGWGHGRSWSNQTEEESQGSSFQKETVKH